MRILNGAPGPVIGSLRALRSAGWRVADVLQRTVRPSTRNRPPLWLQRHTGRVDAVDVAANAALELIASRGWIAAGSRVVDAGCGFGVMAPLIGDVIGTRGTYVGIDLHEPSIRWAQEHIADPRFRFVHGNAGGTDGLPAGDGATDFVLGKSLFTHLMPAAASRVLNEIRRVLDRSTGRALVTTFLFDSDESARIALPYSGSDPSVRWKIRARPEAAVGYERPRFEQLVADAGLTVLEFAPGFWPGRTKLDAQDLLVLGRKGN